MTDTVNVTEEMIRAGMGWREVDENENITDPTASMVERILYAGLAAAPKAEPVSATDDLIDRFAAALKSKLNKAAEKYGYNDDWMRPEWREDLVRHLIAHVEKGDPRDVAAYCAFAWHHGWSVKPEAPKVEQEPVMVPEVFWSWLVERGLAPDDPDFDWNDIVEILNEHENELIRPAPASDELLEALEAEIARLRPHYQGRGLDQARVQMLDHFADFLAKRKGPQS